MKQYTTTLIKKLHQSLKHGDVKRIADACELSSQTVHNAFNDKSVTPTNRRIFEAAEIIIQQHEELKQAVKP